MVVIAETGTVVQWKTNVCPYKLFSAPIFQVTKIVKQSLIMAWQKHHLRRDMVNTKGLSDMNRTKMPLSCLNISGIIKFHSSYGALSERHKKIQNQISVSYVYSRSILYQMISGTTNYLIRNLNLLINVTIKINCY